MKCGCSVNFTYFNEPSLIDEQVRRARKRYYCCECLEAIKPGQFYEYTRGIWNGCWDTYRTCIPCRNLRLDCCVNGWWYGDLRDTLIECLGIDYL